MDVVVNRIENLKVLLLGLVDEQKRAIDGEYSRRIERIVQANSKAIVSADKVHNDKI